MRLKLQARNKLLNFSISFSLCLRIHANIQGRSRIHGILAFTKPYRNCCNSFHRRGGSLSSLDTIREYSMSRIYCMPDAQAFAGYWSVTNYKTFIDPVEGKSRQSGIVCSVEFPGFWSLLLPLLCTIVHIGRM